MRKRIVVWGVVAALLAVAAGLVVVAAGGDGESDRAAPRLPLDLAGFPGAAPAAEPAGADALAVDLAPTRYVAGDDLPPMGGLAPAYPVPVTGERVATLAEALGIDGEPVAEDGSWHAEGNGLALTVYAAGGTWSAVAATGAPDAPQSSPIAPATTAAPDAGGVSGGSVGPAAVTASEPTDSTIACVTTPCEPSPTSDPPVSGTARAHIPRPTEPQPVQECPADPGGDSCVPPCEPGPATTCPAVPGPGVPGTAGPPTTVTGTSPSTAVPTEGPGQQEARELTGRVLTATGFAPEDVPVDATWESGSWSLAFRPRLRGTDAPGLAGWLVVGQPGVQSGSGYFAPAEPLGDYPLLSTDQAIERLNTPGEVTAMGGAGATGGEQAPAAAPTTGTRPPFLDGPAATGPTGPATERVEVVLADVELVYSTVPSWDGSGPYVVPSYRFSTGDGGDVVVNALADAALRPPSPD